MVATPAAKPPVLRDIPAGVWALGFVSLLMDVSSEMIHSSAADLSRHGVLGASGAHGRRHRGHRRGHRAHHQGSSPVRFSDWLGKRKFLAALGYGLAAFTKPIFPLAPTGRLAGGGALYRPDRQGHPRRPARRAGGGSRIPVHLRGASFGLRQSLDTVGAFVGPFLAIGLMLLTFNKFTLVFWVAVVPAFFSLLLILFAVREPERPAGLRQVKNPISTAELRLLGNAYWWVVAVGTVFTLARFSEAFLLLKAQSVGLAIALIPAVFVLMNVVYALAAYPAGVLSDDRSQYRADGWSGHPRRCRRDPCHGARHPGRRLRHHRLGTAHGPYAGSPGHACRRHGPCGAARHRVRGFQSRLRRRGARSQHHCRTLWDAIGPKATFLAGATFTAAALFGLLASANAYRKSARGLSVHRS